MSVKIVLSFLFVAIAVVSAARIPITGRIYGGQEAEVGQFPYQISLRKKTIQGFMHYCGGAILSDQFILTAAHCILKDPKEFGIIVGAHRRDSDLHGKTHKIKTWVRHQNFSSTYMKNDIGLIQLEKPIEFDKFTAPIKVSHEFIDGGVDAIVSGWGRTNVKTKSCIVSI